MIERKKKVCKFCKLPQFIWSKGACKPCWQREYGKPIKSDSGKRIPRSSRQGKERELKYKEARHEYSSTHSVCERCGTKHELDLHHKAGRDGDNRYKHFMMVCRACHMWIHEHVEESYRLGYLISRLLNGTDDNT